jgi:hypothetical protein
VTRITSNRLRDRPSAGARFGEFDLVSIRRIVRRGFVETTNKLPLRPAWPPNGAEPYTVSQRKPLSTPHQHAFPISGRTQAPFRIQSPTLGDLITEYAESACQA